MAATDFIREKWSRWFQAADVNKDGVMTCEDADLFATRFAEHHKMDKDRAEKTRQHFHQTWNALNLLDKESMLPDDYVKEMEADFSKDPAKFRERIEKIEANLLEIFDVDGDGQISEDEFAVVLKCFGIVELDRDFLKKFPQSPIGFIPKSVMNDAWVEFFCNEDRNKIKEEKPVLESLGLL